MIKSGKIYKRPNCAKWIVRYYPMVGGRREKWFDTKREATEFIRANTAAKSAICSHVRTMPELISEYLSACEKGRDGELPLRNDTIRSYRCHLNKWTAPYFGEKNILHLTVADLRDFQMHLVEEARSRTTAQRAFSITKTMLKFAATREYIPKNPAENLTIRLRHMRNDPASRVCIFSQKEMGLLISAARRLKKSNEWNVQLAWRQYYPLLLSLIFLGLRSSEAFGLRFHDFSDDFTRVEIRRRVETPKSYMKSVDERISKPKSRFGTRVLYVPDELRQEILKLYLDRNKEDGFVFCTKNGDPLVYHNVLRRMWKRVLKEGDLPKLGMHSLRHYYASVLMKKGHYHDLSKLLGHSSSSFTMDRYGHMIDDNGQRLKEIAKDVYNDIVPDH